jgi:D-alanyl-D-alanine carboxypeptidase
VSDPADVDEVRAQVDELRAQLRDLEDRQASAEAERWAPRAGRTKGRHEGEVSVTTETWTKSRDADNRREWERAVARSLARRRRRWAARARRWTVILAVWLVITGPAAVLWGKGSPWAAPDCGRTDNTAVIATESVGVRTAKLNGRLLHRLAGKPPTAEEMRTAADKAGKTAIVLLAALRSSARGQGDPAVVSSYNAAYRARNAASCAPPCPDTSTLPGLRTVAATSGEQTARAAAAAAGFTDLAMPVEVARLESQFNPTAQNPHSSAAGMWQIMRSAHAADPDIGNWADPYASARMAYRISRGGTDWSPWTVAGQARANLAGKGAQSVAAQPVADCASSAPSTYRTGAGVAWGPVGGPAYANGRIPLSALAHPRSAPDAWLRPDAAAALDRLSAAYAARFGHPLGVTDSYRDYPHQVSTKARKGNLAAKPGTSNHGWGLALDLVVGGYGSTDYLWLRANAPAFGWDNPDWARPGGSKHEPWHWEYQPAGART